MIFISCESVTRAHFHNCFYLVRLRAAAVIHASGLILWHTRGSQHVLFLVYFLCHSETQHARQICLALPSLNRISASWCSCKCLGFAPSSFHFHTLLYVCCSQYMAGFFLTFEAIYNYRLLIILYYLLQWQVHLLGHLWPLPFHPSLLVCCVSSKCLFVFYTCIFKRNSSHTDATPDHSPVPPSICLRCSLKILDCLGVRTPACWAVLFSSFNASPLFCLLLVELFGAGLPCVYTAPSVPQRRFSLWLGTLAAMVR